MANPFNRALTLLLPLVLCSLVACAPGEIGMYADHEEDEDFDRITATVAGIPNSFTRNNVVDDEIFTNTDLTGDVVQGFLENAPYSGGIRSWLADVEVNGQRASDALVAAAKANGINPLMLLARLQVEQGAVSRTTRPSQRRVDYTMGCGCPDGQSCNTAFKGFDKQMECAANVLREHYEGSIAATGQWRKGRSRSTLDPLSVTPANHATASLYAYTPWVLQGSGGNWLVWNVTKKYATTLASTTPVPQPDPGPTPDPGTDPDPTSDAWVGTTCEQDSTCDLSQGGVSDGECLGWFDQDQGELFGFCSNSCAGYCGDLTGHAPTFCAEIEGQGQCVAVPDARNSFCSGIPGTERVSKPRFVGNSGASVVWKDVCAPKHEAVSCTSNGSAGVCVNTSTNSCSGTTVGGACPGPSAIRCCLP
tara:strand:+ start:29563 stop:30822 length:1260 start_codon:yes stop_codon:yes gene_type:complete